MDDFAWQRAWILDAAQDQIGDEQHGTPRHIGFYLKKRSADRARAEREVEEALLVQAREATAANAAAVAAPRDFNEVEYLEIGRLLTLERADTSRKLRAYGLLLIGLCLFLWYPLSLVIGAEVQKAAAGAPTPNWSTIMRLYAIVGIALCLFSLCAGDHMVKAFGAFLKKRMRLAGSRRILRGAMQASGRCVATWMPAREVLGDHERADPDYSKFHTWLPLLYTVFASLKLAVAVFFGAVLVAGKAAPDRMSLYHALAVSSMILIAPWVWLTGSMCMRYKKSLKEAHLFSVDRPYPKISSVALRGTVLSWVFRAIYTVWTVIALGAFLVYWLADAPTKPIVLVALLGLNLILFATRVVEVWLRSSRMELALPTPTPTSPAAAQVAAGP